MHTISVSDHCSVANNTHEKKKENKKEKNLKKPKIEGGWLRGFGNGFFTRDGIK